MQHLKVANSWHASANRLPEKPRTCPKSFDFIVGAREFKHIKTDHDTQLCLRATKGIAGSVPEKPIGECMCCCSAWQHRPMDAL